MATWYVVQNETTDPLDYGSNDWETAVDMAHEMDAHIIAVVDERTGGVVEEIKI